VSVGRGIMASQTRESASEQHKVGCVMVRGMVIVLSFAQLRRQYVLFESTASTDVRAALLIMLRFCVGTVQ
jgi:hypothetical protein